MTSSSSSSIESRRSGYYHRDAASFVKSLPDDFVDVTITSPPYGSLKDYGSNKQIGHGQSYDEYLEALGEVFHAVQRKTKETGSLWIVADTFKQRSRMKLLPFDLISKLEGCGWHLKDIIIWNKTKTLPWSRRGQFRRIFEYLLFFTKSATFKYFISRIKEPDDLKEWWVKYPERYSPEGKVPATIWTFPIPIQGSWSKTSFRHFCPFPLALVERIVLLTTELGDRVLDPFAGSGVVLAQAHAMGRKFLGCDVNASYRDQFRRVVSGHAFEQWRNGRRQLIQRANGNRRELAGVIRKLRQTKFPKTLFKELRRKVGELNTRGVQAILAKSVTSNSMPDRSFGQIFVYLLCDQTTPVASLEKTVEALAKKPPLSKYGLRPEVHVVGLKAFAKSRDGSLLLGERLFLYAEGNTHCWQEELSLSDWDSLPRWNWKRIPPILTNIGVRQKLVRTWKPEE